jgi:argininosuccinate lyase/argininosuccinate synthase
VKVVLAYSGGLDTSVAARTLRDERDLEVVAALVDLGQPIDADEVEKRAAAAGAELRIVDARDEFTEAFCLPALHANALYEGKYPLVSALARPLIAQTVVDLARETGAEFVAHGCTGKGNDQVRFEATFAALAPDLGVLAPVREASHSRDEALRRAAAFGIDIPAEARVYSIDENLWGRTAECGPIEDPWAEPPEDAYAVTVHPTAAPDEPTEMVLSFREGRPVALDGDAVALREIVARLTAIGGAHGFGRVDMIENRLVGIKSREVYEVPGALALIAAHRDLEDLTLERDLAHEKAAMERRWAELCYYGLWFGPLHASLRAFMAEAQQRVTGEVRLSFFKGSCRVVGRRSDVALYDHGLATYDERADRFDQRLAEGFVSLWSLPLKVWAERGADAVATDGTMATEARFGRGIPSVASPGSASPSAPPRTAGDAGINSPSGASAALDPPSQVPAVQGPDHSSGDYVWSGRFEQPPADATTALLNSLRFDRRLLPYDLRVTAAHVHALHRAGLLDDDEADRLGSEIAALQREEAFPFTENDEDVHVAVERVLTERLGDLGARVHAGRSRNDLAVTDLRLWTKDATSTLADLTRALIESLAARAEDHAATLMPGYTHLQRAQPVTLGHHLLAHAFALARDAERLEAAGARADVSALGAGALAGSTLGLDAAATAAALGFAGVFDNSIDAVSSRDFAVEFLSASLATALDVSRLAEEIVLWSTQEFGFVRVADAYATGSSMMPQKRNPDVAELSRAKAARVLGGLVTLAGVIKGLPLAYDRDLQEDKEAVFDAHDALAAVLPAVTGMVATLAFDVARMREACSGGFLTATDLAEELVRAGVPFRQAHERAARIVTSLEAAGRTLLDVAPDEWPALDPALTADTAVALTPEASIAARNGHGGPGPDSIARQLSGLRRWLDAPVLTQPGASGRTDEIRLAR